MIRTIKSFMSTDTLIMVYKAYFHSLMSYGLIFWGNSSFRTKIFCLQKKVIRIIAIIHVFMQRLFKKTKTTSSPISIFIIYTNVCRSKYGSVKDSICR